jgi:glycine/D-amino acid oxidase-like deaminating enzyme
MTTDENSPVANMTFQQKPYWADTVAIPSGDKSRPLPERTEVAVIGGGFTGLSAARALGRRGVSVVVLEAERFGWGASSRNGGMVLTGLKLGADTLLGKYGREAAQKMYAASLASIDCVEQVVHEEGIACDFWRSGHLEVAWKPAHFDRFQRQAELIAREFNHHLHIVPRNDLPSEIGSQRYFGGLVDEASAGLNPARYVAGLARAAEKAGALLFDCAPVHKLERASQGAADGYRVTTTRGTLWAREVFVATGAYTGNTTPELQKKIIPIGSYIVVTEPLPEPLATQLSPRNRMIFDSKNFLYYFRLTPDRRMLFGGRAAFFPETPRTIERSAQILCRGMLDVYPSLRSTAIDYAWGGTLDFAFDIMPHAGRLDGLHYAAGYAGHGVAMATYLGMQMAAAICGERNENPFAGLPFPGAPLGLYSGKPWFLPFVGAWYKFRDWIS